MKDFGLKPEVPQWAVNAGLPEPEPGEGFATYVKRIGLDPTELLADLHEQTACLANLRLAHVLKMKLRWYFDQYVDSLSRVHLTPERIKELRAFASYIHGPRTRKPSYR